MTIRATKRPDLPRCAEIESAAAGWTSSQLTSTFERRHAFGLVAVHEGAVVGHLLATAVADEGEVLTIAVDRQHRRGGVARRLLSDVSSHWLINGVKTGFLEVREDNGPAIGLYTSSGWRTVGRRTGYYPDGTDALLMSLEIR